MRVAILCGGKGTRMSGQSFPKALCPIGNKPLIRHIMSLYSSQGFNDFIACLGYRGRVIKNALSGARGPERIHFAWTGIPTQTGGRLKKIERLITDDHFFATYGDGLADIDLRKLLAFHKRQNKIATITVVRPLSPFGMVQVRPETGEITDFKEKPRLRQWINGGFFVFHKRIFNYLKENDVLESDTFERLVRDRQLNAFKHEGFWKCMDTYKDSLEFNELWKNGECPWRIGNETP